MSLCKFGYAPIVGLLLATAAGAAPLLPYGNSAGAIKLLDPTVAQSGSNPLTVDTNLTQAEIDSVHPVLAAAISGTTANNIRAPRMAYVKGGQVFVVRTVTGGSTDPKHISAITDACDIEEVVVDFSSVDRSWLLVRRDGADNVCDNGDDARTAVRLNSTLTQAGITVAGLVDFYPVYDAAGAIKAFLSIEGTTQKALKRRNALFASPTLLLNLANNNHEDAEYVLSHVHLKLTALGQAQPQLFRFDHDTETLTPALYTFTSTVTGGVQGGSHNPNLFFFGDGAKLLRLSNFAAADGGAVLTSTAPGSQAINRVSLGSGNAVFAAQNSSTFTGGVYSVARNGANATPITLKTSSLIAGSLSTLIAAVNDFVFINTLNLGNGSIAAYRVNHDGTSPVNSANAYWAGLIGPTRVDFATQSDPVSASEYVIKAVKGAGGDTLRLVSALTGGTGRVMGVIANAAPAQAVFAFGAGRYVGGVAVIQRDAENSDSDTFVFDVNTTSSLQGVLAEPGVEETYFGGF